MNKIRHIIVLKKEIYFFACLFALEYTKQYRKKYRAIKQKHRSRAMRNNYAYDGSVIRKYRQLKGMSQEDLGFLVGSDASPIGKIERNEANPTVATLAKIAEALEMPLAEVFECGAAENMDDDAAYRRIKHSLSRLNPRQRGYAAEIIKNISEMICVDLEED